MSLISGKDFQNDPHVKSFWGQLILKESKKRGKRGKLEEEGRETFHHILEGNSFAGHKKKRQKTE